MLDVSKTSAQSLKCIFEVINKLFTDIVKNLISHFRWTAFEDYKGFTNAQLVFINYISNKFNKEM